MSDQENLKEARAAALAAADHVELLGWPGRAKVIRLLVDEVEELRAARFPPVTLLSRTKPSPATIALWEAVMAEHEAQLAEQEGTA